MTTTLPQLRREDFTSLLDEHLRLIDSANEVELRLHGLADGAGEADIGALQQSAGALVSKLRSYLFRIDQQALPVLDRMSQGTAD